VPWRDTLILQEQGYQSPASRRAKEKEADMSNLKEKVKEKIDGASDALKKTSDTAVDKSKDLAHSTGKTMEKGGKRLQDA
jgi:hypothetical protein